MRKAFLLIEAMIAVIIAGVVALVFTSMNYYTQLQSDILKQQNTKTIIEVVRSRLLNSAEDPDSDSFFELLKEDENNSLPVSIGIGSDAWGKRLFYASIDLGTSDGTNAPYADDNTSISPNDNISGRLISYGEDGNLETGPTDSTSQGDDIMLEIGVGELNHYKLYGSSEITTETRGYNSAIVSDIEPANPINGALWYDINNTILYVYSQTDANWTAI
ncbi:hypothetical protein JHD50_09205 [Sulfurimonas sp. MAG313]|nr:hypothetical protein [Sulfurimonas sp. MAG313]MDF1881475.1 hypothetical protein [Sulfurimonas sp. MAG313]